MQLLFEIKSAGGGAASFNSPNHWMRLFNFGYYLTLDIDDIRRVFFCNCSFPPCSIEERWLNWYKHQRTPQQPRSWTVQLWIWWSPASPQTSDQPPCTDHPAWTPFSSCAFQEATRAPRRSWAAGAARRCCLAGATLGRSLQVKWMTLLKRTFCHPGHWSGGGESLQTDRYGDKQ